MEEGMNIVHTILIPWSIKLLLALVIFVIGKFLAGIFTELARKSMARARIDDILIKFLGTILYSLLIVCVVIATLSQLGVNITALLAVLGAAGLAVGLALKDSLSNFASGIMIIVFKPFRPGDYVEAGGTNGTVHEIGLFNTMLNTPDNQRVIVPNSSVTNNNITNVNALGIRRIDLVIGISYDDDIGKARDIITGVVTGDERVLADPAFSLTVGELGDSSVNLNVRPWCRADDYWGLRWDLNERLKIALEEGGCSIPFPQRDLHIHNLNQDNDNDNDNEEDNTDNATAH